MVRIIPKLFFQKFFIVRIEIGCGPVEFAGQYLLCPVDSDLLGIVEIGHGLKEIVEESCIPGKRRLIPIFVFGKLPIQKIIGNDKAKNNCQNDRMQHGNEISISEKLDQTRQKAGQDKKNKVVGMHLFYNRLLQIADRLILQLLIIHFGTLIGIGKSCLHVASVDRHVDEHIKRDGKPAQQHKAPDKQADDKKNGVPVPLPGQLVDYQRRKDQIDKRLHGAKGDLDCGRQKTSFTYFPRVSKHKSHISNKFHSSLPII